MTRLTDGAPVYVGRNPPDDGIGRSVLVDDGFVADISLRLTNQRGTYVYCRVEQAPGRMPVDGAEQPVGWVLAGEQASAGDEISLLPGSTINFVRDDTVYVSFVVATRAALHGRSPVGRVQFDVAARRSRPKYEPLRDGLARVRTQPQLPEPRPFPMEQIVLPVAMVGALWLGTHNPLSLVTAPIAAAVPIFSNRRQRKQEKQRFDRERGQWLLSLDETSKELTRLAGDEEGNLRLENPAAEAWALRAYRRLAGLWERDAGHKDFLRVRLGLGRLPSRYETRLEEGTDIDDPEFRRIMLGEGRLPGKDVVGRRCSGLRSRGTFGSIISVWSGPTGRLMPQRLTSLYRLPVRTRRVWSGSRRCFPHRVKWSREPTTSGSTTSGSSGCRTLGRARRSCRHPGSRPVATLAMRSSPTCKNYMPIAGNTGPRRARTVMQSWSYTRRLR